MVHLLLQKHQNVFLRLSMDKYKDENNYIHIKNHLFMKVVFIWIAQ
jgi:hypothetical protein